MPLIIDQLFLGPGFAKSLPMFQGKSAGPKSWLVGAKNLKPLLPMERGPKNPLLSEQGLIPGHWIGW